MFDVEHPALVGAPEGLSPDTFIREVAQLTGRIVGINLELAADGASGNSNGFWDITSVSAVSTNGTDLRL